jgi:hypothetical protein
MSESYQVHGAVWRRFLQPSLFSGYNQVEQLFDKRVLSLAKPELADIFRQIGVSFASRRAELFYRFVRDLYGPVIKGDPRNIFKVLGSSICEINLYQRRHKPKFLPGYAEKLLSLLAIYFYEFGIHDEMFPGAYPADRHVQRQLIQSGVVTFDDSETGVDAAHVIAELIRRELIPLIKKLGGTALEFSHAQWFLGNRLCRHCNNDIKRRNTVRIGYFCPLWVQGDLAGGLCIGGRGTADYHRSGKWRTTIPILAAVSRDGPQHELFAIELEA